MLQKIGNSFGCWFIAFDFGRYKGETFQYDLENKPDYLQWLKSKNYSKEPLRTFLQQV